MEVTLRAGNFNEAEHAESALLAAIDRENIILSSWNRDSKVSRWLATRGNAIRLSLELLEVLNLFDHWRAATGGALNASAEIAVQLWQKAAAEHRQPTHDEITQAVEAMRQTHWRVDRTGARRPVLLTLPLCWLPSPKATSPGTQPTRSCAGATGVMLNVGGDIVVRGNWPRPSLSPTQWHGPKNDAPIDRSWYEIAPWPPAVLSPRLHSQRELAHTAA